MSNKQKTDSRRESWALSHLSKVNSSLRSAPLHHYGLPMPTRVEELFRQSCEEPAWTFRWCIPKHYLFPSGGKSDENPWFGRCQPANKNSSCWDSHPHISPTNMISIKQLKTKQIKNIKIWGKNVHSQLVLWQDFAFVALLTLSCPTTILRMQLSVVGWWSCAVIVCPIFLMPRFCLTYTHTHAQGKLIYSVVEIDVA